VSHDHDHGEIAFLAHDACVADAHRPTFEEEWQRRAFGVAVALSEFGHYAWEDFQQRLITAIGDWERAALVSADSWDYYEHWLAALERVVVDAGLVTEQEARRVGRAGARPTGHRDGPGGSAAH
jgi:nitrile hydratase accessory protein